MPFIRYYAMEEDGKSLRYIPSRREDMDKCATFSLYAPGTSLAENEDEPWWKLIVHSVTEEHAEKISLHETLANSLAVFSLGARPVSVSISGYLLTGGRNDDTLGSFFARYLEAFRAKKLNIAERMLQFTYMETSFLLYLEALGVRQAVGNDAYTEVFLTGYACRYKAASLKSEVSKDTEIMP